MRVAIRSDLHLEGNCIPSGLGSNSDHVDLVVLAGDIAVKNLDISLQDIRECYRKVPILFVPGNHEYYGYDFDERNEQMESICAKHDILMLSDGVVYSSDDYQFFGSTLWSDMSAIDGYPRESDKGVVESSVSDFYRISVDGRKYTVDDMIQKSKKEKAFVERMLMCQGDMKSVVIGHFPPLLELGNPIFQKNALTNYFHNDWSDLILRYNPFAWIYGHIHYNSPYKKHFDTHLLSNQRGYNKETSNLSYHPSYVVNLDEL